MFSFWTNSIIDLEGKTLGVIGWGNIGQKVGQIANGFGMKVIYNSSQKHQSSFAEAVDLDQLVTTSDVISLNTHLTDDKYNMIDSAFLKKMKPTAYLINTSRGGLVNEVDLATALKNESIAGAGLDVLKEEPASANHPLLKLDNCIITPHNAWASLAARQRLMTLLEENIQSFIDGHPQNLIN
ncbi:MAG: NAD(P)-dependent oxidoreductase [Chitinophagales bacterium]